MIFCKKAQNSFGATILMVWEPTQVTTTTADDGKTAAVLTIFFYRRLLSHVCRDIDNSSRASQQVFLRFFVFFRGSPWVSRGPPFPVGIPGGVPGIPRGFPQGIPGGPMGGRWGASRTHGPGGPQWASGAPCPVRSGPAYVLGFIGL